MRGRQWSNERKTGGRGDAGDEKMTRGKWEDGMIKEEEREKRQWEEDRRKGGKTGTGGRQGCNERKTGGRGDEGDDKKTGGRCEEGRIRRGGRRG